MLGFWDVLHSNILILIYFLHSNIIDKSKWNVDKYRYIRVSVGKLVYKLVLYALLCIWGGPTALSVWMIVCMWRHVAGCDVTRLVMTSRDWLLCHVTCCDVTWLVVTSHSWCDVTWSWHVAFSLCVMIQKSSIASQVVNLVKCNSNPY